MTSPQEQAEREAERIVAGFDKFTDTLNESFRAITEEFRKLAKAEGRKP